MLLYDQLVDERLSPIWKAVIYPALNVTGQAESASKIIGSTLVRDSATLQDYVGSRKLDVFPEFPKWVTPLLRRESTSAHPPLMLFTLCSGAFPLFLR